MRYFLAIFVITVVAAVGVLGFRGSQFRKPPLYIFPDMEFQLKLRPQKPNAFFQNGLSSQLPVAGTVARATPIRVGDQSLFPYEDSPVFTGRVTGGTNFLDNNPFPITAELLKRGQQRYNINCSPCHGGTADGNGITRKIGAMAVVANLHDRRIVELTDGELFYVITNGRNLMGAYGSTISVQDRWAVIYYVRALQMARLGSIEDVPEALRANLKK